VAAIEASMESEATHELWDRVAERLPADGETAVEIVSLKGAVLHATDPEARGATHALASPHCAPCHEGGARAATLRTTTSEDASGEFLEYATVIENGPACRGCHEDDGAKLGTVYARQSLGAVHRLIRSTNVGLLIAGGVALVVVAATTKLLLGRYVDRPLRTLVDGATRIGGGDFGTRIELPRRTELAVLADTLNLSAQRLDESVKKLARQERLAAIGTTMAGLSHCLKNALNGLRGGSYVVEKGIEKDEPELLAKGWTIVKSGIRQIESLSLDMLTYAGDRPLRREPVVPADILRETLQLYGETAKQQGVELRLDLDERADPVPLDRHAVQRAYSNLVTNAIDACVESDDGDTVLLRSRYGTDDVVLAVEDDGVGIPEGLLEKVREQFFTTKASKGTGLGLPVVLKIVEQHGGALEVDSTPGRGSTFRMRFPLQAEAPPPTPSTESRPAPRPGSEGDPTP
jgi:signal transduction histidine kinase